MLACAASLEVRPGLVPGSVFKTDVPTFTGSVGGFDSHALPPDQLRQAEETGSPSRDYLLQRGRDIVDGPTDPLALSTALVTVKKQSQSSAGSPVEPCT